MPARSLAAVGLLLLVPAGLRPASAQTVGPAAATVLTFEGFSDGALLTTQYAGVTFSNAQILTAGVSLDEMEAPPHAGVNVVSDDNGPLSMLFSTPLIGFGGYFNYAEPLTLDAYNAANVLVASAQSLYTDNFALSGDPGSSPNEYLALASAGGISKITITGDPSGGSFTLDDAALVTPQAPPPATVPEPGPGLLLLLGLPLLAVRRRKLSSD